MRPYSIGLIALTCVLAPAAVFAQTAPTAPAPAAQKTVQIDPEAMALLAQADAKMHSLKTFSAAFTWFSPPDKYRGDVSSARIIGWVRLMKPNYALAEGWDEMNDPRTGDRGQAILGQVFASDGKTFSHWFHDGESTTKPADPSGANVRVGFMLGLNSFFSPGDSLVQNAEVGEKSSETYSVRLSTPAVVDGVPCRVVEIAIAEPDQNTRFHASEAIYIGPDLLVRRFVMDLIGARGDDRITVDLTHIVVDRPMAASSFAFTPPKTAQPVLPPGGAMPATPQLLAAGAPAPDFTVQDPRGHPVKLSDYRGKVIVLDFWATWCGPCQASLPHTNEVARDFKDKNVVVLAVNVWDTPDAFRYWLPRHKGYDSLDFVLDSRDYGRYVTTLYHVAAIPTQYVIDPSGKVAASFVGYDKPNDDLANAIRKAAGGS